MGPTFSSRRPPSSLGGASGDTNNNNHIGNSTTISHEVSAPPPALPLSSPSQQQESTLLPTEAPPPVKIPKPSPSPSSSSSSSSSPANAAAASSSGASSSSSSVPPLHARRPLRDLLFLDVGTQGQQILLPFLTTTDRQRLSECAKGLQSYRTYLTAINLGMNRCPRAIPPGLVQLLAKQSAMCYLRVQSFRLVGVAVESLRLGGGGRLECLDVLTGMESKDVTTLAATLAEGKCPCLQQLNLSFIAEPGEGSGGVKLVTALAQGACPHLRHLHLRLSGAMAGEVVVTIMRSENLRGLHGLKVEKTTLGAEGSRAMAEALQAGSCPALRRLELPSCDMDGTGGMSLGAALKAGSCPLLEVLDLSRNALGDEGVYLVAKAVQEGQCPALKHLKLEGVGMGLQAGMALALALAAGGCPRLEHLGMGINKNIGVAAGEVLRHLGSGAYRALRSLDLTNCGVGEEGQRLLIKGLGEGAWPNLEVLKAPCNVEMVGEVGSSLATALEGDACSRLRELDLRCTFLDQAAAVRLAAALKGGALPSLQFLGIDSGEGVDWSDAVSSRAIEVQVAEWSIG